MINFNNLSPVGYLDVLPDTSVKLINSHCVNDLLEFEKKYNKVYDFRFYVPADRLQVYVLAEGLCNWDEKIHNLFCRELGFKLYGFERNELYIHEDYEKSLCLTYIPDRWEYKDIPALEWSEFAAEEQSSLSYTPNLVVEKLMGEYISAAREYGVSDEQRRYYEVKLEALHELNRMLDDI